MRVRWAEHEFTLRAERALHLPANRALFVADVHLGKDAAFRAGGIPVPASAAATLQRLAAALRSTRSDTLYILGDLWHAREGRTPETLDRLAEWRRAHTQLDVTLIRGNHDEHAGDPPAELSIECRAAAGVAGLRLLHHPPPDASASAAPTLCGHLHPAFVLRERSGATIRLPCFWLRPHCCVLPAFGDFTGCRAIRAEADDRVFVASPEGVHEAAVPRRNRYNRVSRARAGSSGPGARGAGPEG